jgi:hypothetical protein
MQTDYWQQADAKADEQARVYRDNVRIFEAMFLSLGSDAELLGGAKHDQELMEAKHLAASRWAGLHNLEQQVQREEQAVAARPTKRPPARGDDMLATEVIKRLESAFEEESKGRRDGLEVLKAQAKAERKELEAFRK